MTAADSATTGSPGSKPVGRRTRKAQRLCPYCQQPGSEANPLSQRGIHTDCGIAAVMGAASWAALWPHRFEADFMEQVAQVLARYVLGGVPVPPASEVHQQPH